MLGNVLNGETIGLRLGFGAGLILLGLTVHQWESLGAMLAVRGRANG